MTLQEFLDEFGTEEAARAWLERGRWPDGPVCPLVTEPTPPSARISVSEGQELVARYIQPDGSELTATTTVEPADPAGGGR